MKVHVIKLKTIHDYINENKNSSQYFKIWVRLISNADWEKPQDIVITFGSADILGKGSERVVFNIGRNKYRMICTYYFGLKNVLLYINWIGSHKEYDKICGENLQFKIDTYK
ncbi:MAG: type II toxin-antitoxin system HigB family toxin [Saprospiraceae bacterium]|nr:type II toxin-antitoxin system HigB family toxin [Saprospiraceae bacterium]MBK8080440.1 type II toxin-antitoxin system HigB family toxin [Saprospiraceae bacterium]MBK8371324.1 type II toxin-antitoxin system HigB family toxin [Saprospiraceae bacterium]MBK9045107.1 type II toxin-antitoxin system HigB family toxin [Saprospiraceae bacterium]